MKKRERKQGNTKSYAKLNPSAVALTLGIFSAAFILLTVITIKYTAVPDKIGITNFGFARILVSVVYGFIDGVIIGVIFAWLYNKLNEKITS